MTIAIPKYQQIFGGKNNLQKIWSEKKPEIYLGSLQPGHWEVPFSRWWFQPNGKLCNHQVGSFPKVEVKDLKHLKPPGSFGDCFLKQVLFVSFRGKFCKIPLVSWDPSHPFLHVYTCQHRSAIWKNTHHVTEWLNGPTFQGLYKFLSRHFT